MQGISGTQDGESEVNDIMATSPALSAQAEREKATQDQDTSARQRGPTGFKRV